MRKPYKEFPCKKDPRQTFREYRKYVDLKPWCSHVLIILTSSVYESITKRDSTYEELDCEAMCMYGDGAGTSAIILPITASPTIIAHECYHATRRLLSNLCTNIEYTETNETFAYHIGYLVGEVHNLQKRAQEPDVKKR
jgi:hypothetical protein